MRSTRPTTRWRSALAALMAIFALASSTRAQIAPPTPAPSPAPATEAPASDAITLRARDLFAQGAALSHRMQWAEALAAFEETARLKPHPIVTFNIGVCERALGRYTRARRTFAEFSRALASGAPGDVPTALVEEAKDYARELDDLVVHVQVTIHPRDARLAVDGRALAVEAPGVLVANVAAQGVSEPPPAETFEMIVDPGAHVIRASREGHADVLVNQSFAPSAHATLDLSLETLPALLHIESTEVNAIVFVDGRDVGLAPADINRPAGTYRVEVAKTDYEKYAATVTLAAGQHADLTARLTPESHPITSRWWFWAGAATVVAGGVVATYALTRPTPQPPAYQGGSSGSIVNLP